MIKQVEAPEDAARKLRGLFASGVKTGILFGRERWGLQNEEVAVADAIVTFPVNPAFASLNIAQAVLLMSYEWLKTREDAASLVATPDFPPAPRADFDGLLSHLVSALDGADYFHPPEKREKMLLNLTNLIARQGFTEQEIRTLRGVVASLERRWARERHS